MMMRLTFWAVALFPAVAAAGPVEYAAAIKPLFARHCVACHGPDKQRSGLRLDTGAAALRGGNSGPVILAGKSAESLLIKAVNGVEGVTAMPPKGPKLTAGEINLLRTWIDGGAKVPAGEMVIATGPKVTHWSFQPIQHLSEPAVQRGGWVRNSLDRFILARLEKEGIAPSPEADRLTLLRRVYLDLIGLPPSPVEVDAFLADTRPDAYERVVDQLLDNPHYGERWGRHWLDQARYADSNGYSIDSPRSIWPYRDWVIDAFNRDLPFDQFTIAQLAGDLLPHATQNQRVATGFHRNTQINEEGGIDLEQFRVDAVVDRVNTTGSVWLGLTVGCCQCHDHKFDPISQREYYQLFAFLNNVDEPTLDLATPEQARRRSEVKPLLTAREARLRTVEHAITDERIIAWEGKLTPAIRATLPPDLQHILTIAVNGRTPEQIARVEAAYRSSDQARHVVAGLANPLPFLAVAHVSTLLERRALATEIITLKKRLPAIPVTMVVQERQQPRTTYVHLGGDFTRKGAVVTAATPAVLPPLRAPVGHASGAPTRLDLARWLVDSKNPLTARVVMNRYWQAFFGAGIVETDNDFGTQGTPPSHPELLDWLASEFMARKWSVKVMHRLIVTSATYRQASHTRPDLAIKDPRNRLLARQSRLRLEAEVVRDVALGVSGLLTPKIGGPSVFPPQPSGVYAFTQIPRVWKPSTGPDRYRRGMYTHFWRSAPHPGLVVFDAPDATSACTRRNRSNTPLQALTLLNDQAFLEFAQGLISRVFRESSSSDASRIDYAFRLCLARPPRPQEVEVMNRLLAQQQKSFRPTPQEARLLAPTDLPPGTDLPRFAAWTAVARALLNLDEFITRE
jgi:mono/diheme cytochrome c family protein